MTSGRTKALGIVTAVLFLLFVAFSTQAGQRTLLEHFYSPFDPEDALRGAAMVPVVIFFVPAVLVGIGTAVSKVADGRHRRR